MLFHVSCTERDLLDAFNLHHGATWPESLTRLPGLVAVGLWWSVGLGLALLGGSTALFVFGNVLLIAWALKQAWTYLVVPAQIGRLYRQQPGFQVAVSYRVDATGLNIGSPTGETHLPWDRMLRWKRGRSAVLLYHSAQVFNFLPTRLLSDRDLDDLVVLLKAHRVIEERPRYRQARPWLQALAPLLLSVAVLLAIFNAWRTAPANACERGSWPTANWSSEGSGANHQGVCAAGSVRDVD